MRRIVFITTFIAIATGCDDGFTSANEQLHFKPTADLVVDHLEGFDPDHPILEGTELCATITFFEGWESSCFAPTASGPAEVTADDCIELTDPGAVQWQWTPNPYCLDDEDPLVPDWVDLQVVSVDEADARLTQWVEEVLLGADELVGFDPPKDWLSKNSVYRVVEGGWLSLPITFDHPDYDGEVAFNDSRTEVEVVGEGVRIERHDPGWIQIRADAGGRADLFVQYGERRWKVAEIIGVKDNPAEIELVPVVTDTPLGMRAVVRDRDGHVVYGTPIEWTLKSGHMAVQSGTDPYFGPDYVVLSDACIDGPEAVGPRQATIRAAGKGARADVDLDWTVSEAPAELHPECQEARGCGCNSAPSGASWVLLSAVLIAIRRR